MNRIFKYPVTLQSRFKLHLRKDDKVLSVAMQGKALYEMPFIWVLTDTDKPEEDRTFRVVTTGEGITDLPNLEYIGTFLLNNGVFVGHLFEEKL